VRTFGDTPARLGVPDRRERCSPSPGALSLALSASKAAESIAVAVQA
jgi:hypothetical protein